MAWAGTIVLLFWSFRASQGIHSFGLSPLVVSCDVYHGIRKYTVVPADESRPFPSCVPHANGRILLLCEKSKFSFTYSIPPLATFSIQLVGTKLVSTSGSVERSPHTNKSSTRSRFSRRRPILTQGDAYHLKHELVPSK